jgi:hypothetical protein
VLQAEWLSDCRSKSIGSTMLNQDLIQIAMMDSAYRTALCQMLASNAACQVSCVEDPDPAKAGVLVVDPEHLERLTAKLPHPESVVLIARSEPDMDIHLSRAWEAGVHSVIYDKDPLPTAVLAILSARLRAGKH